MGVLKITRLAKSLIYNSIIIYDIYIFIISIHIYPPVFSCVYRPPNFPGCYMSLEIVKIQFSRLPSSFMLAPHKWG